MLFAKEYTHKPIVKSISLTTKSQKGCTQICAVSKKTGGI